jgi:hypothetical protein
MNVAEENELNVNDTATGQRLEDAKLIQQTSLLVVRGHVRPEGPRLRVRCDI